MQKNNVPEWLLDTEEYAVRRDRDSFVDRSTRAILNTLSRLRRNRYIPSAKGVNTAFRLFGILLLIILTASARNFYFVFVMLAFSVILIAVSDGYTIKNLLKILLPIEIISALILLPSALMGNPHSLISVMARIFVSVTLIMRFNLNTPWNEITSALKMYHIPDTIIFTIDLTIQYISILSEVCYSMLTALKVRSIGKNRDKQKVLSGILGTTFIVAKENAEKTQQAMECRGFDGTFSAKKKIRLNTFDFIYIIGVIVLTGIFIYFQAVMK